ncbi:MAG: hypothetical protein OXH52_22225 [Gammaproteobacteria bacterium]|nr:hypothetical protein [Gammaproteobacteria bacterium]
MIPFFVAGTDYHNESLKMRNIVLMGLFIGRAQWHWTAMVMRWHSQRTQNVRKLILNAILIAPSMPAAVCAYVGYRLFDHTGSWEETLAFNSTDAVSAASVSLALVLVTGLVTSGRGAVQAQEGITPPFPLWKFISLLLGFPVCMAGTLIISAIVKAWWV